MGNLIRENQKRGRGRPATGRDPTVAVRLTPKLINTIDTWGTEHGTKSRSETIRRLVEIGLIASTKTQPMPQRSPESAWKASDMAAQQIDKMADSSATNEEQHARKRRLLKGPEGFRDARSNHPKPKR